MKILIVSLLRMGDLVMQRHVLNRYLAQYPDVEVHLLTQSENKKVSFLFPEVKKTYYFERAYLQRIINDPSENLLKPLQVVQDLIEQVNSEKYDLVLNWTHQRTAAYFLGLIEAKNKSGPIYEQGHFFLNGNQYLRKFNDTFSNLNESLFHYVDYLSLINELPTQFSGFTAKKDLSAKENILIQPLTSDSKKNWPLLQWSIFIEQLQLQRPQANVQVLGAEFEKKDLLKYFNETQLQIGSLEQAFNKIGKSQLLISADTVTKHLASLTKTPVVELCLGSSQPSKTGIWGLNSYIVQSAASCHPCSHSLACSQKSQICAEEIQVNELVKTLDALLSDRSVSKQTSFKLFKTAVNLGGSWTIHRLDVQGGTHVSRSRELSFVSP